MDMMPKGSDIGKWNLSSRVKKSRVVLSQHEKVTGKTARIGRILASGFHE